MADASQDDRPSRRQPSNYSSRRVWWRLFGLVAMFMLVLWIMEQARRPQNWYWLWGGNPDYAGGPPLTEDELLGGDREIDTRIRTSHNEPASSDVFTAAGDGASMAGEGPADVLQLSEQSSKESLLAQTRQDGWSRALGGLPSGDEEFLRAVLKAARDGRRPGEAVIQNWPGVIDRLDGAWKKYLHDARQYLLSAKEQLSDEQRADWQAVVQDMESEWRDLTEPALRAAGREEALTAEVKQSLASVQDVLDRIALATLRDNSVFRSVERHAWFRLLEKLDRTSLEQLQTDSTGRVGFVQLFDQPDEYRGKLITVRGTAHLAYRVRAPKNLYGIDHYCVFWLAPGGGPNSPICVYALDTPGGFPALKDKDRDRATTTINEDVEFTGYFFKRWAYQAQDGLRIAPLVLAKTPHWTPTVAAVAEIEPLNPYAVTLYAIGAAALAVSVFLVAYRQGKWRSAKKRSYATSPDHYKERLKALEENDPAEDVRVTLRRLSEER